MPSLTVFIAAFVAIVVFVASLYVSRVYLPMKMRTAYLKSITVLAAAVETRDFGTIGHAQRVAQLAVDLARRLGITGKGLIGMEYAALLMDMGKATVPQAILNKVGPLTSEEWEVVQSHSKMSAEMVGAVPFVAHLKDIILHHHEYWNGSGYPDGLKGDEIPLESRILNVAADYDAMISQRPYHPHPLTPLQALEEIRECSGDKYDPRVVEAFVDMLMKEIGSDDADRPFQELEESRRRSDVA